MLGHGGLGQYALGETRRMSSRILLAEVGLFTLTGQAAGADYDVNAETGLFSLTGQDAFRDLSFLAEHGTFVLTGQDAALQRHLVLDAEYGAFVLTGIEATGGRFVELIAEHGVFVLTGQDAELVLAEGYPPKIRAFPRVGLGIRAFPIGRPDVYTGELEWNGERLLWDGDQLSWNGRAVLSGIVARASAGRPMRARAFGG